MKKILTTAALAATVLGGLAATTGTAFAGTTPGAFHAVTHSAQHPDTTNVAVTATDPSTGQPGGDVWAYDNLSEQFTVTPENAPGSYSVTIDVTGSFAGFADPGTGTALSSNGPVAGTIQYDVSSPSAPSKAGLLANQAPGTGLGAALQQLMPGSTITGGGDYSFSYQNGNYVQSTAGITGSIRGH
jgi:hypothetical protein